ncbi:hypothetical protein M4D81_17595 [Paenibacillus sp. p3-SID867]|uniref:hypothetical protein n=1 Tax=Paenibacillus sp. p3-SID867 TaxID=2916363 RepID=UPI0021A393E6|nr:hypothetical protein [Paenibacillus sp. p3-SID867]MCT1400850.1 hypothetical protein [Paenibacillus sp. p3-SID867]
MTTQFNFNKLNNLYAEAIASDDKTLIFETEIGKGRFLFMMFLSDEDKDSKDKLFIYMRNINLIKPVKVYGNHSKGQFEVYIKDDLKEAMIKELQLNSSSGSFNFMEFLEQLNSRIPQIINRDNKITELRKNRDLISELKVVDEADKTVLKHEVKLSKNRKPQDKTLRKLYVYTDGTVEDITELIQLLKKFNMTVAWTTKDKKNNTSSVEELLGKLNN